METPDDSTTSYRVLGFYNGVLEIAVFKRGFHSLGKGKIGIQEVTVKELHLVQSGSNETTIVKIGILEGGIGTFYPVAVGKDDVGFMKDASFQCGSSKQGIVDIQILALDTEKLSLVEEAETKACLLEGTVLERAMGEIAQVKGFIGKIEPFEGNMGKHKSCERFLFCQEFFYLT